MGRKSKTCTKCEKELPATAEYFYRQASNEDGLCNQCKECRGKYHRQYQQRNRSKIRENNRRWRQRHPNRRRELQRKCNYGITARQYSQMLKQQGNVCAICGEPETMKLRDVVKLLSVDHDHATGRLRALLCHSCNVGLGNFGENEKSLLNAVQYLRKWGQQNGEA